MARVSKDLTSNLFGNPHSQSPSSALSTHRVEDVRSQMLSFFKADPKYFDLVFVPGATAAIKLVAETLRDHSRRRTNGSFWYGYHAAAHTSLVGVRQLAKPGSACFNSDQEVEDWLETVGDACQYDIKASEVGLFAYPAQSNMNGRRLPLDWPGRLRNSQRSEHRSIYSLLDAAAYVATAPLDLSDEDKAPDFVALSFYKIFGFPDLGALIVRRDAGHIMHDRNYFGGGTVDMVINGSAEAWHARKQTSLHEALEDGTPPFHSIIALESAVHVHRSLYGNMSNVSGHTTNLCKVLYDQMVLLRHHNGAAVCRVYKDPNGHYGQGESQGPTIGFNVRKACGAWVRKSDFEKLAIINGIQLRTGGLCNPGGIAWALDLTPSELMANYDEGLRCGNGIDELNGKPTGIIRVSLGAMSSMRDIEILLQFLRLFIETHRDIPKTRVAVFEETEVKDLLPSKKLLSISQLVTTGLDFQVQASQHDGKNPLRCPVGTCRLPLGVLSEQELLRHFQIHKIKRPKKRRFDIPRFCSHLCHG